MQDSFDARMQGQTPEPAEKAKSNKLWIIISAVLLIGVIALAVTEVLAYQEMSKRDEKITELEKKIEELQKPAEKEEEPPIVDDDDDEGDDVDADKEEEIDDMDAAKSSLDAYIKKTKMTVSGYQYSYTINDMKLTKDGKYYYALITVSIKNGSNDSSLEYRLAKKGSDWKYVNGGQAVPLCSELDSDALTFMKNYGKEFKAYATCADENHKTIDYSK